jgi:hypothetical protein
MWQGALEGSSWIWLQASRASVRRRCSASFGGIPQAGGALPRFGLDIGRGMSGWVDGADAVRGHENFFEENPPCSSPIVRLRQMPAGSAPDPPSRTPDARSFKVSAREMAGAFPLRLTEATIHEIAHQVKPDGGLRARWKTMGFPKKCGWPRFHPAAAPDGPRDVWCAPPGPTCGTRCLHVVNSVPADVRRATQSAMNPIEIGEGFVSPDDISAAHGNEPGHPPDARP